VRPIIKSCFLTAFSIFLVFSSCFTGWQSDGMGTVSINLGGNSRAVMPWPSEGDVIHNYLHYEITPIGKNGPLPKIEVPGGGKILIRIPIGEYTIEVDAFLMDRVTSLSPNGERIEYATGTSETVYVTAGRNDDIPIIMEAKFCRTCNYGPVIHADCVTPGMVEVLYCDTVPAHTGTRIEVSSKIGHDWDWATYETGYRECQRYDDCTALAGVGDIGPAGGIIFYAAKADPPRNRFEPINVQEGPNGEWGAYIAYFLEAAPANMPTTLSWASTQYIPTNYGGIGNWLDISGTGNAVGAGRRNTALILAQDATAPAALACINYSVTTFNDWFLPSSQELERMINELSSLGIEDIIGGKRFWSSQQVYVQTAGHEAFAHIKDSTPQSTTSNALKHELLFVRAVRAF